MELSSDPTTRQTQLTAIKDYVNANYSGVFDTNTAKSMNNPASPDFWVWKAISALDDTGMAIDLSEVGALTTAESSRVDIAYRVRPNGFLPSVQNDRALFGDVFSAAGGTLTRPALLAEWQRLATEAEKVLATGTGTQASDLQTNGTVTGSPATLGDGAVGDITEANLIEADTDG